MKQIKEIENPITNEEFIKIMSRLPGDGKIAISGMLTFSVLTGHEGNVILLDDSTYIHESIEEEEDYQKALEAFPEEAKTKPEYLLIKTIETGDFGDNRREMSVVDRSKDKDFLRDKLKDIIAKAMTDEKVEYIGDYEKEDFVLDDSYIGDEIMINYIIEVVETYHRDIYNIIEA